jgi:hypothetical protein
MHSTSENSAAALLAAPRKAVAATTDAQVPAAQPESVAFF